MINPESATSNPIASSPISSDPAAPILECDIVMKGGITSGVVYPLAVVELSEKYRFRNVGGTSAGAIAAAATAAAELGRGKPDAGFEAFKKLPEWLQQDADGMPGSRLQALFQPQPETKSLFMIALAALGPGNPWANAGFATLREGWPFALRGALPALVFLVVIVVIMWLMRGATVLEVVLGVLLCLIMLLIGIAAMLLFNLFNNVAQNIPGNNFGLCNGYRPVAGVEGTDLSLTEWLHEYLNKLAARPEKGPPLTFAHLQAKNINLLMMTTNLTHGQPFRLPLETDVFYFDPLEFAQLFPKTVVDHLCQAGESNALNRHNAKQKSQKKPLLEDTAQNRAQFRRTSSAGRTLQPMPSGNELPVIVAVRMSLSFPILLSAIPLYAVDRWKQSEDYKELCKAQNANTEVEDEHGNALEPKPERCWFSDGGITSNFPVHFFDSPLPRHPTFAINLAPFPERKHKSKIELENVYLPKTNNEGISIQWNRFDASVTDPNPSGISKLLGFVFAIFSTAQNWVDTSQMGMPGQRDRIAHVNLEGAEGGLNLNMPKLTIESLSERGRIAAQELIQHMEGKQTNVDLTWSNHRWVRYRATMAALEHYLFEFEATYSDPPPPGELSYEDLIKRNKNVPPSSYRLSEFKKQDQFAADIMQDLIKLIRAWRNKNNGQNAASFNSGSVPSPRATLRAQPGGRAPGKPVDDALEDAADGEDA
jgi:predicted acylesterase/phospholipase RssA